MNLILWRHAEAEDQAASDLVRQLTPRGEQAQGAAKWLKSRLDDDTVFLVSPATRTIQTMEAYGDRYRVVKELAPGASAQAVLDAAQWPRGITETIVVVGHQPTLGRVAALLMTGHEAEWTLKKSGIWWFQQRSRAGDDQVVLRAITSPDFYCSKRLQQETKRPPRRQNCGFAVTLH
ncbi:MAG: Phosphohistidine phosphatase SixA [Candidatus Burkholderia crenata]|nr:Phosphohistidine phosphatase SixA [Candidatus Burkholderia crenata]CAH2794370.1 MAG: Phosphohistidine phosphatase SixA [Candidatus Burkholderia crenata]